MHLLVLSQNLKFLLKAKTGVKQGDNLSPNIFNLYLNDIVDALNKEVCDPVKLGSTNFNCLLYADDIILLSESEAGLQKCPDKLSQYCESWCLNVNYEKSKVMIFNKAGRLYGNSNYYINNIKLEVVRQYKYLGIICSVNGRFSAAISDLMKRGHKAYFKFCSLFKNASPSVNTMIHTFDHTIKPILLYSAEVWGMFEAESKRGKTRSLETMFDDLHIEKLNVKFCKYLLGVNKKASNLAVRGELGRYPLLIDVVLSMVKYWVRLNDTKNKITDNLLLETIKENKAMADKNQPCWLTCLKTVLFEIGMPNIYLHPAKCTRKTIKDLQIKLKSRYVQKWHQEVSSIKLDKSTNQDSNKLRTYKTFKNNFKPEKYLLLSNFEHRKILSQFRISAHRLEKNKVATPHQKLQSLVVFVSNVI